MGQLLAQAAILGTFEKLTTAEVLAGITYRAAAVLGLKDRGIVAKGMLADLALFKTHDHREILYHQGSLQPSFVIKKGTLVYSKV
jgi:imidazolonepropionase